MRSVLRSFTRLLYKFMLYFRYKGSEVGSQYGTGTSPVWNDNINCVGNEKSIADCPTEKKSIQCGGGVVSVSCGTSPVQYGSFIHVKLTEYVGVKNANKKTKKEGWK